MAVYTLLLFGALVIAAVLLFVGHQPVTGTAAQDARLVYCLQPAHRPELIGAATTLGLVQPGSLSNDVRVDGRQLTISAWRKARRSAFGRACAAIAAVAMPATLTQAGTSQEDTTRSLLNVLLPVAAGALLTLAIDDLHSASDRGWAQADALRSAWRAFARATGDYARDRLKGGQFGVPDARVVDERRADLVAALRSVHARHRRSRMIRHLQDELIGGTLSYSLALNWAVGDDKQSRTEQRNRADQIQSDLDDAQSSLENVAYALEHLVWPFWKL